MLTINQKIKTILGREPEVEKITYKGQEGYVPLYFNYAFRNNISKVFAETEKEALNNFYQFLVDQGDTNGTDTSSDGSSSTEDQSPSGDDKE